jgi:hypothetical protein
VGLGNGKVGEGKVGAGGGRKGKAERGMGRQTGKCRQTEKGKKYSRGSADGLTLLSTHFDAVGGAIAV